MLALAGKVVSREDGDESYGNHKNGHDIGDGPLPGADEFVQHPDWKR